MKIVIVWNLVIIYLAGTGASNAIQLTHLALLKVLHADYANHISHLIIFIYIFT